MSTPHRLAKRVLRFAPHGVRYEALVAEFKKIAFA